MINEVFLIDSQATGLAVITIGACLLSWNAYLSEWMPTWSWTALGIFTVFGVGIAASSTSAAIATVAPKPKAAHKVIEIWSWNGILIQVL